MRILSVSSRLGSGADSYRIESITNQLRSKGHEVNLVQYQALTGHNWFWKMRQVARYEFQTLGELLQEEYDLVYGNGQATSFGLLAKVKGVPLVFDMHGFSPEEYLQRYSTGGELARADPAYLARMITDEIDLRAANIILCVSITQIKHLHEKRSVPLKKLLYVTNGVDVGRFREESNAANGGLRNELGLEGKVVIGYFGSTYKGQGVEKLVACARTMRSTEAAFLIVGGNETYRDGNLTVVRKQPREGLPGYYAICDALVLPLPRDPATEIASPTKFAEYAAAGKPIISTDVGDPPHFIREKGCGLVANDDSVEGLAEQVANLLEMPKVELLEMGKRSRILAKENFDWNVIGDRLSEGLRAFEH